MLVVLLGPVPGGCPGVVLSALDEVVPCGLSGVDDTEGVITALCPVEDPVSDPVGEVLAALLGEDDVAPAAISGVGWPGVVTGPVLPVVAGPVSVGAVPLLGVDKPV